MKTMATNNQFEDFFGTPQFDFEEEKRKLIANLDMLKNMSVQEQTLYKKYEEIQEYSSIINRSQVVKAKIWKPLDIQNKDLTIKEITNLQPMIRYVDPENESDMIDWLMLRIFCHTMAFDQNPGRFLRFLVYDKISGKYLGAISLASDVLSIAVRDKWIGWDANIKIAGGKVRNSAIGSCIMSTQPLGYNFLGGKLVASLLLTKTVRDKWKELYNDELVGITTTSLYGSESMYNSIPFWKKLGSSEGKIAIKPDQHEYGIWHQYIKDTFPKEYNNAMEQKEGISGPVTGAKQRIIQMIFRATGIKSRNYEHGFKRGVYYAPLYENSKEYLCGKIDSKLIPSKKLDRDIDSVINWWKPKAISRYERLHSENKLNNEILFYNRGIGLEWNEFRDQYYKDVGR